MTLRPMPWARCTGVRGAEKAEEGVALSRALSGLWWDVDKDSLGTAAWLAKSVFRGGGAAASAHALGR